MFLRNLSSPHNHQSNITQHTYTSLPQLHINCYVLHQGGAKWKMGQTLVSNRSKIINAYELNVLSNWSNVSLFLRRY